MRRPDALFSCQVGDGAPARGCDDTLARWGNLETQYSTVNDNLKRFRLPKTPSTSSGSFAPPPAPWQDWDQVRQVREALREHRFLLMRRPEHLSADQQALVADLLASPPAEVKTARTFLLDWYAVWKDHQGNRRSVADAHAFYEAWRSNPVYLAVPTSHD